MSVPVTTPGTPGIRATSGRTEGNVRPAAYPREGDVQDYPKSVFETARGIILGDPDRKWGPFYKHVRAAKKEGRWEEWDTTDIVAAEPNDRDDVIDPDEDTRRAKKSYRTESYILANELRDDVRPAHINVEEILGTRFHPGDYDDQFFRRQWAALYNNTVEFVNKWFDERIDLRYLTEPQQGPSQIWGMELSEQFIEYARLVVHEDPKVGGWPAILNEGPQRKWLIVGILAQIMEKKIFNELFFGADDLIQAELDRLDNMWIEKEGYGRKSARSITARYGLEGRLLPRNFWTQVDDLAAKSVKILLPLLNAMKEVVPRNATDSYTLECFLQEMHAIFAHAGLIQVCTAISPSIFHFLSATPGARMDYDTERQSDMQIYRDSKAFHEEQDRNWTEYVTESMSGRPTANLTGLPIKLPQNEEERRTMEYHRIRGARVKFAVFPKLTRYHPVNKGKGGTELGSYDPVAGWEAYRDYSEGQDVANLSDCWVIYKQGLIYPEEGVIEGVTLDSHMSLIAKPSKGLVGWVWVALKALFSFLRKSFWHLLCLAAAFLFVSSFFVGARYFQYIAYNKLPYIVFSFFCMIQIAQVLFRKGNELSAWTIVSIPITLVYLIGIVSYTMLWNEGTTGAAGDPASPTSVLDRAMSSAGVRI